MSNESLTQDHPFPGEQPETEPGGVSREVFRDEPVIDDDRRVRHEWYGGTGQLFGDKSAPSKGPDSKPQG